MVRLTQASKLPRLLYDRVEHHSVVPADPRRRYEILKQSARGRGTGEPPETIAPPERAIGLSFVARVVLLAGVHGPWIFPDELGYEQVAAGIARGHLALYGHSGLSYSPLYPLILSPLYGAGLSASDAYEGIKIVNAA